MDRVDRELVNRLQDGIEIEQRPFAPIARALDISEDEVVGRLERLVEDGYLSRFGPLYNADRMGGAVTLAALAVPPERMDEVAGLVNAHVEVSHNYARDHDVLNMWFVVSAEAPDRVDEVLEAIEKETGLAVYDMPKEREYYIGLRLAL